MEAGLRTPPWCLFSCTSLKPETVHKHDGDGGGFRGGYCLIPIPHFPEFPPASPLPAEQKEDGWILSINNRQSKAKTTMSFFFALFWRPGLKVARGPDGLRSPQHSGPRSYEGKVGMRNLEKQRRRSREMEWTCLYM